MYRNMTCFKKLPVGFFTLSSVGPDSEDPVTSLATEAHIPALNIQWLGYPARQICHLTSAKYQPSVQGTMLLDGRALPQLVDRTWLPVSLAFELTNGGIFAVPSAYLCAASARFSSYTCVRRS